MIDEIRPLLDKQVMLLDGRVLKGDHSFKIIKSIGKTGGSPKFSALYKVCNEYEEIRMQSLVPTKSLNHLRYSFEAMRDAYSMYGHRLQKSFSPITYVATRTFWNLFSQSQGRLG